jgi:polysaccharide export outer membrane protein
VQFACIRAPTSYCSRSTRSQTLRSVIARAGGLTDCAFPEGSVFTRESLNNREQEQADLLADRVQRDLTILAVRGTVAGPGGSATALSVGQSLLSQLRIAKAIGRLVIDLPRVMQSRPGSLTDVGLRSGDHCSCRGFSSRSR